MFKSKLQNNDPFAFSRFSDGEMYILQNRHLKLENNQIQIDDRVQPGPYQSADFKSFNPDTDAKFQTKLVNTFQHKQPNYFKGISCSCCVGKENFDWQIDLHNGDDDSSDEDMEEDDGAAMNAQMEEAEDFDFGDE